MTTDCPHIWNATCCVLCQTPLESQPEPCATCGGEGKAYCHAARDGDCSWEHCPQAKNYQSGCVLADWEHDEEETEPQPCPDCQPQEPVSREHLENLLRRAYKCITYDIQLREEIEQTGIIDQEATP